MAPRVEASGSKIFGDELSQDSTRTPSIVTSDFEAEVRLQFSLIRDRLDGVSMQVAQIVKAGVELRQPPPSAPAVLPGGCLAPPRSHDGLIKGTSPMLSFFGTLGNFVANGNSDIGSKAAYADTNELTEAISMLEHAAKVLSAEMANRTASILQVKSASSPNQAQMNAEEEESKAKEKEAKMRKEKEEAIRANREHDAKAKRVSAVVTDVQNLLNAEGIDGMLADLQSELECRKTVWQMVVPREGENYKRCVEILTEKISEILHIGTKDLDVLQSKLQEVSVIAKQTDALGKSMGSLLHQLVETLRVAPNRSKLLKLLQGLEKDIRLKKSPQKLPDSLIDPLLQECLLEQSLKSRVEEVLHQEPRNPEEKQDTKKTLSQPRGRRPTS